MEEYRLRGDVSEAQALTFVLISGRLFLACGYLNGHVCIWDAETRALQWSWKAHAVAVTSLASLATGELWSHGRDGWAYRWTLGDASSATRSASEPVPVGAQSRSRSLAEYAPQGSAQRAQAVCVGYGSLCRLHVLDAALRYERAAAAGARHHILASAALHAEKIEVWELLLPLDGSSVAAAARDDATNAAGLRLLATLEPPVKEAAASPPGAHGAADDDADAAEEQRNPAAALQRMLGGKTGMAMCVQLLQRGACHSRSGARWRALPPAASPDVQALPPPRVARPTPAASADAHSLRSALRGGGRATTPAAAEPASAPRRRADDPCDLFVAAAYENGVLYILDAQLGREEARAGGRYESTAAPRSGVAADDAGATALRLAGAGDALVSRSGETSHALLALRLAMLPILAFSLGGGCASGVAGSADAAVLVFALDVPAGTGSVLRSLALPLPGTSATCVLSAPYSRHLEGPAARGAAAAERHRAQAQLPPGSRRVVEFGLSAGWDGAVRVVELPADSADGVAAADGAGAPPDADAAATPLALRGAECIAYAVAAWPTPTAACARSSAVGGAGAGANCGGEEEDGDGLDELLHAGPFAADALALRADAGADGGSDGGGGAEHLAGALRHAYIASAAKDGTVSVWRIPTVASTGTG